MVEILVGIVSATAGAIIGGYVTWIVTTRAARNQARRDALVKAAQALQDYRVAYAQWYTEHLSPQAQGVAGSWARPPTGKPDPVYLGLMSAVDRGRGLLRVITGLLYADFPQEVVKPICKEITTVLAMSGPMHADCREVDCVVEGTCDLILDLMRKYSQ